MSFQTLQIALFLLIAASLGGILFVAVYPGLASRSQVQKRLAKIAQGNGPVKLRGRSASTNDDRGRRLAMEKLLSEIDARQKARATVRPSLSTRMRQAGIGWSTKRYLAVSLAVGLALSGIATLFGLWLPAAAGFGLAGGLLGPHLYVNFRRKKRFKAFANEFPGAVDVVVRGVKSGLPLVDCIKIIAAEGREPLKSEFRTTVEDQTLGLPIGEAVMRLAGRVPLAETNFFAVVIAIQSRAGGSLSEALGNLSKVLRDRKGMRLKIKALSSEAKASAWIIGSMPVIVGILVYVTSPDYIMLLFTTFVGNVVLVASGLWMLIGVFVMRKMINFDF